MKKNKIDVYDGAGTLTGPNGVAVKLNDGKEAALTAKNIIIATGARPRPFPGVDFDDKSHPGREPAQVGGHHRRRGHRR